MNIKKKTIFPDQCQQSEPEESEDEKYTSPEQEKVKKKKKAFNFKGDFSARRQHYGLMQEVSGSSVLFSTFKTHINHYFSF